MSFVHAREKLQPHPKAQGGLLSTARDWQLLVDLVEVGRRGFAGRSWDYWESVGSRDVEPPRTSWKPLRRLPSGSGLRGVMSGAVSYLDTSWGLINPGRVTWKRVS